MGNIVIKLGGSVITYKETKEFPLELREIEKNIEKYVRVPVVKRLINELYEANNFPLIVVNGVGPFGHYLVENQNKLKQKEIIHESVALLNDYLISVFESTGVKVKSFAPFNFCKYLGSEKFEVERLFKEGYYILKSGGVLSTYGDIAPTIRGVKGNCYPYQVISGDDLMVKLAELWKAEKIINVMDLEGVFTENPKKSKEAKLIRIVKETDVINFWDIGGFDVTGGMRKKLEKLFSAAKKGTKVQIITGFKKGYLERALMGDESIGTLILP